ncbi:unnamed protein product [Prunus armeniaca]|uniref:Pentatricopeptide repeat-containing protein n=1 Tax=Prunus armeniaca TaxID=36596 RepID=A0A6J5TGF4_PRUAR|nr:unnamed protein product [Prunus armeniaca]
MTIAKRAPALTLLHKGNPSSLYYSLFGRVIVRTQFCSLAINRCHTVVSVIGPNPKETIDLDKLVEMRCKSGNLGLDEALGHFNSVIQMNPIPSIWAVQSFVWGTLQDESVFRCSFYV